MSADSSEHIGTAPTSPYAGLELERVAELAIANGVDYTVLVGDELTRRLADRFTGDATDVYRHYNLEQVAELAIAMGADSEKIVAAEKTRRTVELLRAAGRVLIEETGSEPLEEATEELERMFTVVSIQGCTPDSIDVSKLLTARIVDAVRRHYKIPLKELQKRTGINYSYISRILSGDRDKPDERLQIFEAIVAWGNASDAAALDSDNPA